MLYEIFLDASQSNYDPRRKPRPHVDGIIGSANAKYTNLMTKKLKDLSLSHPVAKQDLASSSNPT